MKGLYLALSLVFTVLILILAFENIGAQCSNMFFFFYGIRSNPTVVVLGIAVLGIITGGFFHAFLMRVLESTDDEENEDF